MSGFPNDENCRSLYNRKALKATLLIPWYVIEGSTALHTFITMRNTFSSPFIHCLSAILRQTVNGGKLEHSYLFSNDQLYERKYNHICNPQKIWLAKEMWLKGIKHQYISHTKSTSRAQRYCLLCPITFLYPQRACVFLVRKKWQCFFRTSLCLSNNLVCALFITCSCKNRCMTLWRQWYHQFVGKFRSPVTAFVVLSSSYSHTKESSKGV